MILDMDDAAFESWLESWLMSHGQPGGALHAPAFFDDSAFNASLQPVVSVCWREARAYCAWLSAPTDRTYRLPTEHEWQAAARGQPAGPWQRCTWSRHEPPSQFQAVHPIPIRLNPKENHMTRRRIPVAPFPASSTAADLGATPQTRNAAPSRTARQVETIAERRVIAIRLRKAGGSYREIAGQLAVDVATAYADVRTGQVLDAIDQTRHCRQRDRWPEQRQSGRTSAISTDSGRIRTALVPMKLPICPCRLCRRAGPCPSIRWSHCGMTEAFGLPTLRSHRARI